MSLIGEVDLNITRILQNGVTVRDGRVVPKTEDVSLTSEAVKLEAAYVYADMADSSKLAQVALPWATGKIIQCYVNTAARTLRQYGGEIRSFDGDRVMAIFVGEDKETRAVRAALALNYLVEEVLHPAIKERFEDISRSWVLKHGVGIDSGECLIMKAGVRQHNDLVSVGGAPNIAAKLSEIRGYASLYITEDVYTPMSMEVAYVDGTVRSASMWNKLGFHEVGGKRIGVFSSSYRWAP